MEYNLGLSFFGETTKLVGQFDFPLIYNLLATFLFALTGVILATKRGYDLIGVGILALITGAGGGLIRDGIFLQQGPVLFIQSPQFILAVFYAILVGSFAYHVVKKFNVLFYTADALGLGIYGIIGAQMTLNAGLGVMAAILVGFSSAIGGGMIRDVLIRREPVIFFPGQYYALAALIGIVIFLMLGTQFKINAQVAAIVAIAITFILRLAAIRFDLKSKPLADFADVNRNQFFHFVDSLKPVVRKVKRKNTKQKTNLP
jgi:uncharacterized membrane protein YeiH